MIEIDIISDTICPWCFIGKRKLESALCQYAERTDAQTVEVRWHPYQLNPDFPPEGMERGAYLEAKFGGAERARGVYDTIRAAGRQVGIEFVFELVPRTPNTFQSHRVIHFAGESGPPGAQDAVVERLFRAAFQEGRDIGDREVLVRMAAQAGVDGAALKTYLDSDQDIELLQQAESHARNMGVNGVPFFVFNGKFAVSGAQDSDVLLSTIDQVEEALAAERAD